MLPYQEIWEEIHKIILASPAIATGRKYSEYDQELFDELTHKSFEYYINTVDFAGKIDDLTKNIESIDFTYRYKSESSIKLKLDRLNMTKQLYKIMNDMFGMRFVIKASTEELQYIVNEFVAHCPLGEVCNITDQSAGKKNDDGYKGIHVYIRPNNLLFPIEVQFWTRTHSLLNEYLHDNIYKIDNQVLNQYALDIRDWLETVPTLPKNDKIEIISYVDYIYEQAFSTKAYNELDDEEPIEDEDIFENEEFLSMEVDDDE